jgi:epoxyqueuosine reductase
MELKKFLREKGAALAGVGDLTGISANDPSSEAAAALDKMKTGISVAVPVPARIVEDLETAPTLEYLHAYDTLNSRLDEIVSAGEQFLRQKGFSAYAQTTGRVSADLDAECNVSALPHKTVATRAGIGWIGKSSVLVTPEYGGAVRISSILTDAPLDTDEPYKEGKCGSCSRCAESCPAKALKGVMWKEGMKREELFDWHLCYPEQLRRMKKATGIETDLCGMCFAVCPFTQRYLERSLSED